MIITVTNENFESTIMKSSKLCILDFWAEWCNPCKALSPIIDNIYKRYKDSIVLGKVNVDNNDILSERYSIQSIPTILFIKNNKVIDKEIGLVSEDILINKIDQYLL
ncbi:MAG: thioredoxin [Bacteroides sp.]|nr:MAG: thioredoxin [Bacteroides sp.]